jgi:hypothetical protein
VWPIDPARPEVGLPHAVGTDELRTDLVALAVDTDVHLAGLRRAPARIRRAGWREASDRVVLIEDLAARLQGRPAPGAWWGRPPRPVPAGLQDLVDRMQCLEHGRAEIAHVEAIHAGHAALDPKSFGTAPRVSSVPTPTR